METVASVLLFHPDPIWIDVPRQRCFCKTKSNNKMLVCEECDEWYHWACVGVADQEEAEKLKFVCGYCQDAPDEEGLRRWKMPIPQGNRKRLKKAPDRNDVTTPRAIGLPVEGSDMVPSGPRNWDEVMRIVAAGGKKINLKEKALLKRAADLLEEGGHHLVDEVVPGGVQARAVSDSLADELFADEGSLIDGSDDGHG